MRGKERGRGNVKAGGDVRKNEEEEMGGVKEGGRDQSRWEGRKKVAIVNGQNLNIFTLQMLRA